MNRLWSIFGLAVACLVWAGCGEPVDPQVLSLRQQLILKSAPDGAASISSMRKTLMAEDALATVNVVVLGRIQAGKDSSCWETGKAAFVLTDATGHKGETDHDPHTCPYCSPTIEDYLAFVSFRGEDGKLIEIDSRELFDVKERQLVIITGEASLDDAKMLTIDATEMFIKQP